MWREFMNMDPQQTKPEKLTGIALHIQEIFQEKMNEVAEIKELVNTANFQKRMLLENLLHENNFKVLLRSTQNSTIRKATAIPRKPPARKPNQKDSV